MNSDVGCYRPWRIFDAQACGNGADWLSNPHRLSPQLSLWLDQNPLDNRDP